MSIPVHQPNKDKTQFPDFIYHVFQNVPNGILIIDADMNIIFSNDYMLNYFDIPPYLAGGLALGSFLRCSGHKNNLCGQVPECRNCSIRKGVTKIFREGTTIHGMTIRLVCNIAGNEKTKWFSISGSILFHIDEVYCILSFMDITAYAGEYPPLDYTALINHVDKLLYEAKSNGKNRLVTDKGEYPF